MTILPFKRPENQPRKPANTQGHPPLFNVPPLTLYTFVAIVLIQGAFAVMPQPMMQEWGYRLAFVPLRYTDPANLDVWAFISPFTHLFMHGGWLHVAMNGMMLVAFGAACERVMGPQKTAILFILCGIAGAFTQFALDPSTPVPMVGASGALSGIFAAVIMRMQKSGAMPAGRFGIWGVAALWIGLSFASALVGGAIGLGNVAWAAHAGGFLAGIALARLRYFS